MRTTGLCGDLSREGGPCAPRRALSGLCLPGGCGEKGGGFWKPGTVRHRGAGRSMSQPPALPLLPNRTTRGLWVGLAVGEGLDLFIF